jgi:hypothetical protein
LLYENEMENKNKNELIKSGSNTNINKVFIFAAAWASISGYLLALKSKEIYNTLEKINKERENILR